MSFIIGLVLGFLIRHILWYPDRRDTIVKLFKRDEHNDNKS
jgi:hypothetical protein